MSQAVRKSYHHGSLREDLIEASIRLIESEGIGAVSLRRVAREAGVSSGAPYHHFDDRSSLLAAIATRGQEILTTRLATVAAESDKPATSLALFVETYVSFAVEHRGHIHVMLRPELFDAPQHPSVMNAGADAIELLTATVVASQAAGTAPSGDPAPLVGMVWALAVGIVGLWIDGPLEKQCVQMGTSPAELTTSICQLLESFLVSSSP